MMAAGMVYWKQEDEERRMREKWKRQLREMWQLQQGTRPQQREQRSVMRQWKYLAAALLLAVTAICLAGCGKSQDVGTETWFPKYEGMTAEEITSSLTNEQKAAQMVLAACYDMTEAEMKEHCYGGILSVEGQPNCQGWQSLVDGFQQSAVDSETSIPYIYGQDQVHGAYGCKGAVIYPHNIGLGAADDEDLMYRIGQATADESKMCHILWNYGPVVAQSVDPRWGRTYESYGSDLKRIRKLSVSYTKGLQESGVAACAKHFFGDGNVQMGTGEQSDAERLIDRGDAELSEEQIDELLAVYQAQIDAGVKTIMLSHSSVNGVKMHENKKYIDILRNEMGFRGLIVGDWDSVTHTSGETYYDQIVNAVNAGVDMLMEVSTYEGARRKIVEAVEKGDISQARMDEAVTRIIALKLDLGLFEDPFLAEMKTRQAEPGSAEYRALAEEAVEKSLVLVKNENKTLPLKKGSKVYVTGPAANNEPAQCGGWTMAWAGSPEKEIPGVTSLLEGLEQKADEYGLTVITDPKKADQADVVLLAVGEKPYAEWLGDAENIDLCGDLGLEGNRKAIREAKALGKPVVCCIIAGRNVWIDQYVKDWDSTVMCYLPGSEGQGIADMLCGAKPFSGKLPSPWYRNAKQIGTGKAWHKEGYGLKK